MLSLVSGYAMVRILPSLKRNIFSVLFFILSLLLLFLVAIYPYFAIFSYYESLKNFKGLNGISYMQQSSPDDFAAIAWLNTHVSGQPVILEAQGDSYTDYERISSYTGLPTVFGWTVHEWLWRGTYDIAPQRIDDVKNIYESSDIALTKTLLKKYSVQFIIIGNLERTKYTIAEKKFEAIGNLVFIKDSTKIVQVHD
jgi:uncharacterized membrane protein